MDPITAAALASGGANLVNQVIGAGSNRKANRDTIRANKAAAELAYQRQVEMFNRANEYNTPAAQMQRLKDAGLNPNLVYNKGADNTTAVSTPQYTPPEQTRKAYVPDFASSINQFLDTRMRLAQIDNVKAGTDNIKARTISEGFNATLKDMLGIGQKQENEFRQENNPTRSDILQQNLDNLKQSNKNMMQQLMNMSEQKAKILLEQSYIKEKTTNEEKKRELMKAEQMFKDMENDLRKMGIQSGDNVFLRILIRALNNNNILDFIDK